jgi:hypothetical protein
MDYCGGSIGRVFVVRVDNGDNLLEELKTFASTENITSAFLFMLGALSEGNIVIGPKEKKTPPDPIWFRFTCPHEIIGIGNIFMENGEPGIHLHASLGRDNDTNTGCMREKNEVFMVTEILVLEIAGMEVERVLSEKHGFSPICFKYEERNQINLSP